MFEDILKIAIGIANLIIFTEFSGIVHIYSHGKVKNAQETLKVDLGNMVSVYIGLQKLEQSYSKPSYSRGTILEAALLNFCL